MTFKITQQMIQLIWKPWQGNYANKAENIDQQSQLSALQAIRVYIHWGKKNNKLFYKLNENDDEKTIGLDFLDFLFLY